MLVLLAAALANPYAAPEPVAKEPDPFVWTISPAEVEADSPGRIELKLEVPDGTSVYKDQLEVKVVDAAGLTVAAADWPPARPPEDDGRVHYDTDIVVWLPITADATLAGSVRSVELELRHQGCRKSLCWSPVTQTRRVAVTVRP